MGITKLVVRGARQHNLKNINVEIPRNSLTVITGLSGSGKSSLAFDTIFAEGQRRYVESLSADARQFLGQMDKPGVDFIDGLSPAGAVDPKAAGRNPRATVGTITDVYDYLRLLYGRGGGGVASRWGRRRGCRAGWWWAAWQGCRRVSWGGRGCSASSWRACMTGCRLRRWSRGRSRSARRGGRARTARGWARGWRSTRSWWSRTRARPWPGARSARGAAGTCHHSSLRCAGRPAGPPC